MKYWADQGFQWHPPHALLEKSVGPIVQETTLQLAHSLTNRGMKKVHAAMLLPECDYLGLVSAPDVEKAFCKCNLGTGQRRPKVLFPVRCHWEAYHTNMIWHTDLHHFHHGGWIIAWVDGQSRMCLSFKFLPNQSSAETANTFCEVVSEYPVPYSIWTDNGKEFEGSSQKVLIERGIRQTD
jgi:hypothetical protein